MQYAFFITALCNYSGSSIIQKCSKKKINVKYDIHFIMCKYELFYARMEKDFEKKNQNPWLK